MWVIKYIKAVSPDSIFSTTQLGKEKINITLRGYDKKIIIQRIKYCFQNNVL